MNTPEPGSQIPDPPPPGETGRELTAAEAAAVITHQIQVAKAAQRGVKKIRLCGFDCHREGRYIALSFRFWKAPYAGYTVRVSRAWASIIYARLGQLLGA